MTGGGMLWLIGAVIVAGFISYGIVAMVHAIKELNRERLELLERCAALTLAGAVDLFKD